MFNFGASKPRVKGEGARPPGPPGSAPVTSATVIAFHFAVLVIVISR